MARPPTPGERQRARDSAKNQASQQATIRAARRKRTIAIVGLLLVILLVLGIVGGVLAGGSSSTASSTTTTSKPATTTTSTGPTIQLAPIAPGVALTEPTPCPPEDGSAVRTTTFAGPPPTCIDTGFNYSAVIHTTVGDLTVLLNTTQAPNAVNNFVVLSRYRYYDGQPFSLIFSKQLAGVSAKFANPSGVSSPGYTLPSEVPAGGQVNSTFTISFTPIDASGAYDAPFLISTFGQATDFDVQPTSFGLVTDGQATLQAIDKAGTEEGQPTQEITITSIDISRSVPAG